MVEEDLNKRLTALKPDSNKTSKGTYFSNITKTSI